MGRYVEKPTALGVLNSSTLLGTLGEKKLQELAGLSHLAYAERGEVIWMHGSHTGFFGLVGNGFVKMVRTCPGGTEVTCEIMGPGQAFGLLGAVDGNGCPLSARAVTNLWYLKVPKGDFVQVLEASPITKDIIFRRTNQRLKQSFDTIARLASTRIEARIAAVLFHLAESYGERTEEGLCVGVPLTRQDIAEMVGTTVETTIRIMSRWQKDGLIATTDQVVTIKDEGQLFR